VPAGRLHPPYCLAVALSALATGCGAGSDGPSCNNGDHCTMSAECCDGLVCRLPSEGILPVPQELKCRTPVQGF